MKGADVDVLHDEKKNFVGLWLWSTKPEHQTQGFDLSRFGITGIVRNKESIQITQLPEKYNFNANVLKTCDIEVLNEEAMMRLKSVGIAAMWDQSNFVIESNLKRYTPLIEELNDAFLTKDVGIMWRRKSMIVGIMILILPKIEKLNQKYFHLNLHGDYVQLLL